MKIQIKFYTGLSENPVAKKYIETFNEAFKGANDMFNGNFGVKIDENNKDNITEMCIFNLEVKEDYTFLEFKKTLNVTVKILKKEFNITDLYYTIT